MIYGRKPWLWITAALGLAVVCALIAGIGTARAAPRVSAWATAINAGLLAGTFVAILWYSVESQAMRRAIVRQTEIAVRPLLVTTIEPRRLPASDRWDDMLVIRNIGNAPALFVHLEDIALQESPEDPAWRLTIAFEVEDVIEPHGDGVVARTHFRVGDEEGRGAARFVAALNPRSAREDYQVVMSYEDINKQPHRSVMNMGKSGIRLASHS